MTTSADDPTRAVLDDVLSHPAWALIRTEGATHVTAIGGTPVRYERLADVPLDDGPPSDGRTVDRLLCVPYAQIRERGFQAHDDDAPLLAIETRIEHHLDLRAVLDLLPDTPVGIAADHGFDIPDDAYADVVRQVIRDEIGNGEGANVVISRDYRADLRDWSPQAALGVLGSLLRRERGAYWTFVVFTGERYLVGASPERHVLVSDGTVSMNPISGTFRLAGAGAGAGASPEELRGRLLEFLADEKEIYELYMVVDEELKMMCALCSQGGSVLGPFLKPMSHLIHTEYVLQGRSALDPRDILRGSMFAATVTGSPVENACRLIHRYEHHGRGYYGSVLAAIGRAPDGAPRVDAPIILRTADVGLTGELRVTAGATLVRDSDPDSEVAETRAKAAGILSAFGLAPRATVPTTDISALVADPEVQRVLLSRNDRLSTFWLSDQSEAGASDALAGKHVVVLDGEDDFVAMLRHVLGVLGMTTTVVSYRDYHPGLFDGADLVIVGPGPGDPRELADPKIATVRSAVASLLEGDQPFLAVCLGHQVLAGLLGLPLEYKDIVFQGTQTAIGIYGRTERVGFYNTFVAKRPSEGPPAGIDLDADPTTGDVHRLRGSHFSGIQFHAESILTQHGFDLIRELMLGLLDPDSSRG